MALEQKTTLDNDINLSEESTSEALASEEVKAWLRNSLWKIVKPYDIKEWDNISVVANNCGLTNFEDLIIINRILGVEFEKKWKNIIVKKWKSIFIPKEDKLAEFSNEVEKLRKINDILKINKELNKVAARISGTVTEKQLKNLKKIIFENENIFPKTTKSPGISKMWQSFIDSQKYVFDEDNPRIVDVWTQRTVSCANLIRRLLFYSISSEDLTPEENEFFRKKNIDAWMLPEELISVWFAQKMNLMDNFDPAKVGGENPIGNKEGFDKDMISLTKHLEKSWVPGSLVPFYFKYSKFKWVVADYNKWKKNKHYNTHQSLFLWNWEKIFKAFEVKNINDWKKEPFWIDTEASNKELNILKRKKEIQEKNLSATKLNLSNSLNDIISGKTEIIWTFDKIIDTKVVVDNNWVIDEDYKRFIVKVANFENKDEAYNYYLTHKWEKFSKKYPLNKASIDRIVDLSNSKKKVFSVTKNFLVLIKAWELIDRNLYKDRLAKFPNIIKDLDSYNASLKPKIETESQITTIEWQIKDSLNWKKSQPISDYLVNFVQQRADYWSSALSDSQKWNIWENLSKFASIINIKINGKTVNLETEFKKEKSKQLVIKPSDSIEISWPMMIDGLHMVNSDSEDRAKNMNARTRFLWEFIVSGVFYPTELIEPTEKSSFYKKDFANIYSDVKMKWNYDLRVGDTIESVLKSKIPIFEKEAFDKLDKLDSNYDQERKNLLQFYYAAQIKALQLSWTMQSENDLNRDAANINRPIFYFDSENIDALFNAHIKQVKESTAFVEAEAVYADYVDIISLPWDSAKRVFYRIKKKILGLSKFKTYPNLSKISNLNDYLQMQFIAKFVERSIKSKNIKEDDIFQWKMPQNSKFVITLEEIDKILSEITEKSFHEEININPVDKGVIDIVVDNRQNENLEKIIIKKESYPTENWEGRRLFLKKKLDHWLIRWALESLVKDFSLGLNPNYKAVSSFWDFQLRFDYLRYWYSKEWPTRQHLQDAIALFKKEEVKKFINFSEPFAKSKLTTAQLKENKEDRINRVDNIMRKGKIEEDLAKISKIEKILQKENPDKKDFSLMVELLQDLMRLDDWGHSNIVWKIIWTSLLNDKINTHFEKLNWILLFAWEKNIDIYKDEEKMKNYENTILLMNNLWEEQMLYWLTENFIIRSLTSSGIIPLKDLDSLQMKQEYTKNPYKNVKIFKNNLKQDIKWWFSYNKTIFIEHLEQIIKKAKTSQNLSAPQKVILSKTEEFIEALRKNDDPISDKELSLNIFKLLQDKELKETLKNSNISTSILPESSEYTWINFRNKIFRYVNTME
ncbi:MAG: hypothetical protein ACD_49C00036G0006 [uncultured bacterium (gcode 4)]|uniref:Uncharacterized protein n=1 Tax=uncultured bacterium (gcode 4) TaxID=1234023 RepID=K2BCP5_9BACT|nr:MAG: hypothetical protein ACD_49C00036G0006 [uncultured bacterium (gcode 4)]